MNVQFIDIESMIADLRHAKIKSVKLQAASYKKQITYENKNHKYDVPHRIFEVLLTARVKDEYWIYIRKIALVNIADDKRRLNTAKKHMAEAEKDMRSLLVQNKFDIGSGAYYG